MLSALTLSCKGAVCGRPLIRSITHHFFRQSCEIVGFMSMVLWVLFLIPYLHLSWKADDQFFGDVGVVLKGGLGRRALSLASQCELGSTARS